MLEDIQSNITKLIALYEGEKQRADSLAAQLAASEQEKESYRQQITELTRQIDNLKLAGAFGAPGQENPEARERINALIREIDKCIRLLEG